MFRMVMIPLLVVAGACSGAVDPNVQVIAENIMSEEDISEAMRVGIMSIDKLGKKSGVIAISAGNYGGKLGPHHFHLRKIIR